VTAVTPQAPENAPLGTQEKAESTDANLSGRQGCLGGKVGGQRYVGSDGEGARGCLAATASLGRQVSQLTAGTPPLKVALQSGVTPSVAVGGVTVPQFPEAGLTADQSKRPPPSVGLTPQFDDSRAQNAAAALLAQGGP
jgi:hypothetical protein